MHREIAGVQGFIRSAFFDGASEEGTHKKTQPPVVTISRDVGAQGEEVAVKLAERLGSEVFGYSILDAIVEQAHTDKPLMELIDERFTSVVDDWIRNFFSHGGASKDDYVRQLVKTVSAIAKTGGVIIGRGAHLILSTHPRVLRVKVEGSREVRIRRLADKEKLDLVAAEKKLDAVTAERVKFVHELYKHFPTSRSYYDLVVSSDRLKPEDVAEIILFAMKRHGLEVPESVK